MTATVSDSITFQDPLTALKGGYDIHVYFTMEQHAIATSVYKAFLSYLNLHDVRPTFSFLYDTPPDFEGGPHKGPMWTVQLMGINPARDVIQDGGNEKAVRQFGVALSWLMLNRNGLKILVHPNVAMPFGEVQLEKVDHTDYALWMGAVDPLPKEFELEFFDRLLEKNVKDAQEAAVKRLHNATNPTSTAT
ncbi:unnamed protein product [Rotaria socialis]|uniref:Uncharacterized protein n=2 Tax=Rotaria socialis TaxID=392032 RepID=A0A818IUJ9_9BILA|nr:unnamed protein product [Rotaria socialis]